MPDTKHHLPDTSNLLHAAHEKLAHVTESLHIHHHESPQEGLGSIFRIRKWGRLGYDVALVQGGRAWARTTDNRWAHIDLSCVDHVDSEVRARVRYLILDHCDPDVGVPKCGCVESLWLAISDLPLKSRPQLRSALLTVVHPNMFSSDAADELSLWHVSTSHAQSVSRTLS